MANIQTRTERIPHDRSHLGFLAFQNKPPITISTSPVIARNFYGIFFFSSRRRHTRSDRDWSSDVCSSDLERGVLVAQLGAADQRVHARQQFRQIERLGEVVVGAALEAPDPRLQLVARREQEDRKSVV